MTPKDYLQKHDFIIKSKLSESIFPESVNPPSVLNNKLREGSLDTDLFKEILKEKLVEALKDLEEVK